MLYDVDVWSQAPPIQMSKWLDTEPILSLQKAWSATIFCAFLCVVLPGCVLQRVYALKLKRCKKKCLLKTIHTYVQMQESTPTHIAVDCEVE